MKGSRISSRIASQKKIVEKLHLEDGGRMEYTIRNEDSLELKITRKSSGKDLLLMELENPRKIGVKGSLRRQQIHENIDRH